MSVSHSKTSAVKQPIAILINFNNNLFSFGSKSWSAERQCYEPVYLDFEFALRQSWLLIRLQDERWVMGGLDLLDLRCRIPGGILRQNLPLIILPSVPKFCETNTPRVFHWLRSPKYIIFDLSILVRWCTGNHRYDKTSVQKTQSVRRVHLSDPYFLQITQILKSCICSCHWV